MNSLRLTRHSDRVATVRRLVGVCFFSCALAAGAMTADEQMQFADGLFVRGLHDMAVREYIVVARDFPDYGRMDAALFRIGECYRQLDQTGGAERFYRRVMNEFPMSEYRYRAELRRAELFVTAGQYADAVSLFRVLLAGEPPPDVEAAADYYLGYCLDKLHEDKDAAAALRRVVDGYPDSAFYPYAYLALAEHEGRVGGDVTEIQRLYGEAAKKAGTDRLAAEALFQLGELSFREGDFAASADAYGRLMKQFPDDERVADARLQAAWSFQNAGDQAAALALAEEALSAADVERREDWMYLKANSCRQLGRPADAIAAYTMLLEKFPKGATASAAAYEEALIHFRNRDYARAVASGTKAKPEGAVEQDLYWILAESHAELGHRDEAAGLYRKILAGFGDGDRAPQAAYQLARLHQDGGDWKDASDTYRALAKDYPDSELAPLALFLSGFCLGETGDPKEALKVWKRLLSDYPDYEKIDEALYQKALAEVQVGKPDAAVKTFLQLVKDAPDSVYAADAYYGAAVLYDQDSKWADAEANYRLALDAGTTPELDARIRYRLALVLQKQGREDESAELLQALLVSPARGEMTAALLEWLARYQFDQGAFAESAAAAKVLSGSGAAAQWKQIGWYLAGRAAQAMQDPAAAADAYQHALAVAAETEEGAWAALLLADIRLEEGALDDAEALYEAAAERASTGDLTEVRARSYFGLGRVDEARDDPAGAARYYLSVAVLFDDPSLSPESLYRAAGVLRKAGRGKEAADALEELKTRYPKSEWNNQSESSENNS